MQLLGGREQPLLVLLLALAVAALRLGGSGVVSHALGRRERQVVQVALERAQEGGVAAVSKTRELGGGGVNGGHVAYVGGSATMVASTVRT